MKYFGWLILLVIITGGGYWISRSYTTPPGVPTPSAQVAPVPPTSTTPPDDKPEAKQPARQNFAPPAGGQNLGGQVREISLEAGYFFFKPNSLVLKKGQPVKLIIKNNGSHTFTIDELGINEMLRGNTATVEFTPNKTGTFEFYCAIPGHRQSGQFGTMVVE